MTAPDSEEFSQPDAAPDPDAALDLSAFDEERMYTIHPAMFGWIVLVFTFLTYQIVGGITAHVITSGEGLGNISATRFLTLGSQLLFLLAPALVLVKMQPWTYTRLLSLHAAPLGQTVLAVVAVAALQIPMQGYMLVQEFALETWLLPEQWLPVFQDFKHTITKMYSTIATAHSPSELAFVLFVVALTPAVCEELLFRGVVLGSFRRGMRTGWALVLSGVAFGLFHLNPVTLVPLTALGILLAWITWKSGSIVPAITAHAANNTIAIFLLYFGGDADTVIGTGADPMPGTAMAFASLLSIAVFVAVIRRFHAVSRVDRRS